MRGTWGLRARVQAFLELAQGDEPQSQLENGHGGLLNSSARPSPHQGPGTLHPVTPLHTDLGTCHSALGEGAGISGPSQLLYQKGPRQWEAWGEVMEEPSHCRDLDGRGRERPVNPASQHLLQADLLALNWPSHQTSKVGSLSRPEKAQFLWVTACFGDWVTHPPGRVPAGYPPSPSAFQQHPSYLPLAHPPPLEPHLAVPPAHFRCHILERKSRGLRGSIWWW